MDSRRPDPPVAFRKIMTRSNKSTSSFTGFLVLPFLLLCTTMLMSCRLFGCYAFHSNQSLLLRPIMIPNKVFLPSSKRIPSRPKSALHARSPPPPPLDRNRRRTASSWEGDDIRWVTRVTRRLRPQFFPRSDLGLRRRPQPARTAIVLLSVFMFLYQTITTILWIRHQHPTHWSSNALTIVWDVLWGTSIAGPLILDGGHFPIVSPQQPHRFWTNGVLHVNWVHWILLLDAWQRLPSWLETGLGTPLYLTTILIAQVAGNVAYTASSLDPFVPCLGWSGGICGLYGLWYVTMRRMQSPLSSRPILRRLAFMAVYGWVVAPGVSNAAHVGGLLGGLAAAILFGPRFSTNYRMRRKWSTAPVNPPDIPPDYQRAMRYDVKPGPSLVPLSLLWGVVAVLAVVVPKFRSMPLLVWNMVWRPGSVSGLWVRAS